MVQLVRYMQPLKRYRPRDVAASSEGIGESRVKLFLSFARGVLTIDGLCARHLQLGDRQLNGSSVTESLGDHMDHIRQNRTRRNRGRRRVWANLRSAVDDHTTPYSEGGLSRTICGQRICCPSATASGRPRMSASYEPTCYSGWILVRTARLRRALVLPSGPSGQHLGSFWSRRPARRSLRGGVARGVADRFPRLPAARRALRGAGLPDSCWLGVR